MAGNEISKVPSTKKIRQTISVPFVWEERPGMPKEDWRPSVPAKNNQIVTPVAVKFIASVPFQWEEKPGKPLPCNPQSANTLPQADIISPLSPPRYSEDDDDSSMLKISGADDSGNSDEMSQSELDEDDFYSDHSFSSAPSLLANGFISTLAISNAVPAEQTFLCNTNSGELQCPLSPASQTESTSSYATGSASLAGSSFLGWLFPQLTTADASSSDTHTQSKIPSEEFNCESNHSITVRRPHTLGELILMSRRRSYQRKAIYKVPRNPSMDLMKKNALGCCMFGANNGIGQLHQKWKRRAQLKIM